MTPEEEVVRTAGIAAGSGAFARLLLAIRSGQRVWLLLAIEALVGAVLGMIAAAAAAYLDPDLRGAGWALLFVGAAAGLAGAIGTRSLDFLASLLTSKRSP
jgi:ABC-type uncharacterized transport system permease subunit